MSRLEKKSKALWIISIVLIIGIFVFFSGRNAHDHSKVVKETDSNKTMYLCPMHPQVTSDKKGTCSICGMDLVLNEDMDHSGHDHEMNGASDEWEDLEMGGTSSGKLMKGDSDRPIGRAKIKLSGSKKQLIGVKTSLVSKRNLYKTIRAPARVAFDPELYSAQSEYHEALRQWRKVKDSPLDEVKRGAQEMIQSAKVRLKVLGLSDSQIKILARDKSSGEGLLLGEKNQAQVYAEIFENELPFVDAGLSVEISSPVLGAQSIEGVVMAIDNIINTQTRTARVRIRLEKTNVKLRPETFVTAEIKSPLGRHLSVPKEAVLNTGKQTIVFVEKERGVFEPKAIHVSMSSDEFVAIHRGLSEGERVSIQGNFMLDSESRLKGVLSEAISGGHNH